ncbi:rhodanese-related sulfurtransferase [Patescibacteria group bacterium]|nr:rhodanese-related sulfurtransferase [Patescibacteria group bacterium]
MSHSSYEVLLFYKYVTIENPQKLAGWIRELAKKHSLLGRAIIAEEGINATFEGIVKDTEAFVQELIQDGRLSNMSIKRSAGQGNTFPKLSVKVRDEIVGTHFPQEKVDPRIQTAPHLSPKELRSWYANEKDFVVVDMRNDYEFASGHFKDSINPGLENSRDLPQTLPKLESLKDKKVVTVCTGGVRCEKMSAYLMSSGFTDVYQLQDGIHSYMEKYPGEDFLGTLYTFDQRLTMDFGGDREIIGVCHLCNATTEQYINCANNFCHLHFLVCVDCFEPNGKTFCSIECKEKVSVKV